MLKSTFLFLLLLGASSLLFAQKYSTAGGIRLGSGIGLTVQQKLWDNNTLEGIVQTSFGSKLTTVTALFEQHHSILTRGMNFYMGAGPHFGAYGTSDKPNSGMKVFGASLIGGLELKLGKTVLSVDYKPMLNLSGGNSFFESQSAVSLRYVFIKAKPKEHKWMFWKKKKADKEDEEED